MAGFTTAIEQEENIRKYFGCCYIFMKKIRRVSSQKSKYNDTYDSGKQVRYNDGFYFL